MRTLLPLMLALAGGCAHLNTTQQIGYVDLSAVPIGPCAFVAVAGTPGYSRPESSELQIAVLNWGAFPVIIAPPPPDGWMAIAINIGVEAGDRHRSVVYVRSEAMSFDMRESTMSPGDIVETDWSLCSNGPTNQ